MKKISKKIKKILASLFIFFFYSKSSIAEAYTFYGGMENMSSPKIEKTAIEKTTITEKLVDKISSYHQIIFYGILIYIIGLICLIPKIPKKCKKILIIVLLIIVACINLFMNGTVI